MMKAVVVVEGVINIRGAQLKVEVGQGKGGIIKMPTHILMLELGRIGNYNKPIIDLIHHILKVFHNHIQCPVYLVHLICLIDKHPSLLPHTYLHQHSNTLTRNIKITHQPRFINNLHHSKLHHIDNTTQD